MRLCVTGGDTWILNFAESNLVDKNDMGIVVGSSWDILLLFFTWDWIIVSNF